MKIIKLIKEHKVFTIIIVLSVMSSFRSLFMPLLADETTYNSIASNLLNGRYYQNTNPSTVSPIIPFILAFFKTSTYPIIGITLHKLFHILLAIVGFRYLYLFLLKQNIKKTVIIAIVALAVVNPIGISFFGRLYPEGILMFSFWGFIYYATSEVKSKNFIKMLLFFVILIMTRYLYAVLGVIILFNCYRYYKVSSKQTFLKLGMYCILFSIPILFWGKYVYHIEQSATSTETSYFNRFKEVQNPILYNIKCGLGIEKHHMVQKTNGIPAFASLFLPIDGFRNYIISILLIIGFILGYYKKLDKIDLKVLLIAIILPMIGLIFAGTGFSRYWLILTPGYILGYYFLASKLNIPDRWFIYASYALCGIYIINEIRLDFLVLNRYL